LVNVQEKRCRLRWETVAPPRLDVEPVKIVDGLAIAGNERAHIAAFRFANSATDLTVEASDHFLDRAAEIECLPVEFSCRIRGGLKRFAPPDFQVLPAAFPREANKAIFYYAGHFRVKDERFAHVAEWEADTASSSERT